MEPPALIDGSKAENGQTEAGRRESILLVNDDPLDAKILFAAFKQAGFEDVATCDDGLMALELAESRQFDLVIADLNHSTLDSAELAATLRLLNDDCAVIVLGNLHEVVASQEPTRDQGVYRLETTIDLSQLFAHVNSILKHKPDDPQPNASASQDLTESLQDLLGEEGALGAAVIDAGREDLLGAVKAIQSFGVDSVARSSIPVMQALLKQHESLDLNTDVEDVLTTWGTQYHLMRPIRNKPGIFLYYVLDREQSNLPMARRALASTEARLR